ncbi:PQQ-binding-like beta-propeller repeat protein [candidate division KSB1 bacterium]|nr:PQQ-binding-like beta-propeller repeat protein [candidate division KSB1 bacterium]
MKKKYKVLIISFSVLAVLFGALTWFYYWGTSFSGDLVWTPTRIPLPAKNLPALKDDPNSWPAWKGPNADDTSPIENINKDWSNGLPKVWEIAYLCKGPKSMSWSTPAIKGNRLIVPGRDEQNDILFCLDPETGHLLWYKKYEAPAAAHNYGQGHRATPTIDGDSVYTLSREGLVQCHAIFEGDLVWSYKLTDAGCESPEWGFSGSPLIYNNMVILHAGGNSLAVSLNKTNGSLIWKSSPGKGSYTSPTILQYHDRDYIVILYSDGVAFIDPNNGDFVHHISLDKDNTEMTCTTPVIKNDHIFVSALKGSQSILFQMIDEQPQIVWRSKAILAYHTNPFLIDNNIYSYSGMAMQNSMGKFVCISCDSGNVNWETKDLGIGTTIYADGHFICLDLKGNLFLVKPNPEKFELVTEFPAAIPDVKKRVWTKPVIAGDYLYLRHGNRLICYNIKSES